MSRIILTRPAVEAGEKLGFLPGDLQSKVDPYLRPLYDGLFDMLGAENFAKYQERGSIEVAPLAYMRGRTLDDSFIICLLYTSRYNREPFHLRHALTVEAVMRYFAEQRGEDADFWGVAGLLHDIDFEQWPEQHCVKAPELLREGGADEALSLIHI